MRLGDFERATAVAPPLIHGSSGAGCNKRGSLREVDGFMYDFIVYFSTIYIHARRFSTGGWSCITRGAQGTQVAQEAHKERVTRGASVARVVDLEKWEAKISNPECTLKNTNLRAGTLAEKWGDGNFEQEARERTED